MKNRFLLALILSFTSLGVNAQYFEDFEVCPGDGGYILGDPNWSDWGCQAGQGCTIECSTEHVHGGIYSGLIPRDATTSSVLSLGNKIFEQWSVDFWMYVPSGSEASWNLQGSVPIGSGEWIVGNIFHNQENANPGMGLIEDSALGQVQFQFPHDQWFQIGMAWDLSFGIGVSTWQFIVDGVEVLPQGTPFTNNVGTYPSSLGGINFFSNSINTLYYVDDICFNDALAYCSLGIMNLEETSFAIYPIPFRSELIIENNSNAEINSIIIYDLLGRTVFTKEVSFDLIELSHLNNGVHFIKIETDQGDYISRIIKE